MKKISVEELNKLDKEKCVRIEVCSRTRACGWRGFRTQMVYKEDPYHIGISNLVCPMCSNNDFYTEWMPLYEVKLKYVK